MSSRVATTLWTIGPELVVALDERLGPPVDSYVNGTQTWLTDEGPGGIGLEWRLHPAPGYRPPHGLSHYDLWETVVTAFAQGAAPEALPLGTETRPLASVWEGLECFAPYGDEVEPVPLATAVTEALGRPPDLVGLVDHDAIGDAWEQAPGEVSIVALLAAQLADQR